MQPKKKKEDQEFTWTLWRGGSRRAGSTSALKSLLSNADKLKLINIHNQ